MWLAKVNYYNFLVYYVWLFCPFSLQLLVLYQVLLTVIWPTVDLRHFTWEWGNIKLMLQLLQDSWRKTPGYRGWYTLVRLLEYLCLTTIQGLCWWETDRDGAYFSIWGSFGLTPFPLAPLRNSSIVSCPTFLRHLASKFPPPPSPPLSLRISNKSLWGGYGKFPEPHNFQPIGRATQILVVTRHQYGISTLVPQTAFHLETSGDMGKWQPFTQATQLLKIMHTPYSQMADTREKTGA